MRHLRILAFVFVCAGITPVFADDLPRYDITATVDTNKKTLAAFQEVTFTNTSDKNLNEIYFHIYPNRKYSAKEISFLNRYGAYFKVNPFPTGYRDNNFKIHSIKTDDRNLAFKIEGEDYTILKVSLDKVLASGESVKLVLDFSTNLPNAYSRFGWVDNIFKLSHWYPVLSVLDKEGWHNYPFYPFHRPFFSEAAYYDVQLTVPDNQVVVHTGSLLSQKANQNETKTLSIKASLPVRDFTVAMSDNYLLKEDEYDGVKIKSFYLPDDEKMAVYAIEIVKDSMAFYSKYFGKYPYPEFSIVPVPLGNDGEQMANLSFIDDRMYKLPGVLRRYFEFIVAHEMGHQWLYNLIGIDEFQEMWLEEGVNSHFINEYIAHKYGKEAEILDYPEWFKPYQWLIPDLKFNRMRDFRYKILSRLEYDHPVVSKLSSFVEPSGIFALAYGKGSAITAMLRDQVGQETFDRIFKRIGEEYRYKNIMIADFIRICQEESHKDLTEFFDQWFYTDKKLDYAVTKVKDQEITVEQRGGVKMPLKMKVEYENGVERTYDLNVREKKEVYPMEETAPIKRVSLDPQEKLLDLDRTNNNWPRRFRLVPVPFYLGLYDVAVFLPEDSYNIIFGPEWAYGPGVKVTFKKPYDYRVYAAGDYEFGEQLLHSRVGYEFNNLMNRQMATGFEFANVTDLEDGDDDLTSGKLYLRRELWPAQYGLTDINDHVTFYLLRNRSINDGAQIISGTEDGRSIDYSRRNESILGTTFYFNRSGPFPDPVKGYLVSTMLESAGHFLGASQYFFREAVDLTAYHPVTPRTKMAARVKFGAGQPDDKALFYIGGMNGLRGYDRKTIRGANILLGNLEYRFPIKDGVKYYFLDNIFGIESIAGVVFTDVGQSWFGDFGQSRLRKDAGAGLRVTVNVAGVIEKFIVRLDVAQAINDPDEDDTRFWFGINHAF